MSCPLCSKPAVEKYRPFCSKRCADIDLAKWLTGSYAVPSQSEDNADELLEALDTAYEEAAKRGNEKLH